MEPSVAHQRAFGNATQKPSLVQMFAKEFGSCPMGQIPIHHASKHNYNLGTNEFIMKKEAGYTKKFATPQTLSGIETHQHAALYTTGSFLGFSTTINVWQPYVEKASEFSLSQLWLISSRTSRGTPRNTIEAGWQVYPALYGGYQPRLFVYWTADGYNKTGCYNLKCPGFVQVSNTIVLEGVLAQSTSGSSQQELEFLVFQFRLGATEVASGGEIYYDKTVKQDFKLYDATSLGQWIVAAPGCYNVGDPTYNDTNWATFFFFGGPGYNPASCP
ncbi:uncharacterized protein LOC9647604 [Selaginella moellendorffii]|uniref:uncharacterized protein LOC9647604 n=1 Tax=Selaginella moellendorffii TaxID=88036 RepID=UPI000D1CD598|nr:uncharacterized protein LOC9647604 [Selaginella moellendorffii]|eukprot:XP_024542094.1 uncharacterized protein LOC9647604 [Selaginella moellendorffii]